MKSPSKYKAFTLIELLVVIAIIGILSGIVLTSFSQVRARARGAQRAAILRNLSIALEAEWSTIQQYPSTCTNVLFPRQPCAPGSFIKVLDSCNNPTDYVPLLVEDGVMPNFPHDPQEDCIDPGRSAQILYYSNGIDYKIIIFNMEGCEQGQGEGIFGNFCWGAWPFERYWVIQTPGAVNWPLCFSQFPNSPPYSCI